MKTANVESIVSVRAEGIPDELKVRPQWVAWRYEKCGDGFTKVPYNVRTGRKASTTDLMTWGTFEEVLTAYESGNYAGIGFVFSSGDPYVGVDLDGCVDPETGEIEAFAKKIVADLDSYTEVSPSGKGLHVIAKGKITSDRKGRQAEMYSSKRFFTMTGRSPSEGR